MLCGVGKQSIMTNKKINATQKIVILFPLSSFSMFMLTFISSKLYLFIFSSTSKSDTLNSLNSRIGEPFFSYIFFCELSNFCLDIRTDSMNGIEPDELEFCVEIALFSSCWFLFWSGNLSLFIWLSFSYIFKWNWSEICSGDLNFSSSSLWLFSSSIFILDLAELEFSNLLQFLESSCYFLIS
jgi:hypothetical protein